MCCANNETKRVSCRIFYKNLRAFSYFKPLGFDLLAVLLFFCQVDHKLHCIGGDFRLKAFLWVMSYIIKLFCFVSCWLLVQNRAGQQIRTRPFNFLYIIRYYSCSSHLLLENIIYDIVYYVYNIIHCWNIISGEI